MNGLRKGYVVATHPEDHSVDLVMADDGSRMIGVQVLTPNGSTRSGSIDMPAVPEKENKWDISKITGQDQLAIVGFLGTNPVVLGFLYPQVNQMTFDDPKMRFVRHQSDVYSMVDGDGNMELFHPSGTYVRIAETPEHADLGKKNTDKNLAPDRNTGRRVHFHIEMAGAVASVDISPDGKVVVKAEQNVEVHTQQNAIVTAAVDARVTAGESVQVEAGGDADVKADGNASVRVNGWSQTVSDGPMLVKSKTQLKLQGPSRTEIL